MRFPKSEHDLGILQGKYFFLTLPNLGEGQGEVDDLKDHTFRIILEKEGNTLQHLGVVREAHKNGSFHLHVYVQYVRRRRFSPKHFDYLPKHPNVQIVRGLKEVLNYLIKQDSNPRFTKGFNPLYQTNKKEIQRDPYRLLQQAMLGDPLGFKPHQWLAENNLTVAISKANWSKAISLVKKQQQVEANRLLRARTGVKKIDRQLIETNLSSQQLAIYDSWDGYQVIVDHLNQIPTYGYQKPHKLKNLFVIGRPNIGKTALAREIRKYVAVYSFGVDNWYPHYENWVYPMILWNQFYLRAMPYGQLLNVLEGEPTDLPYKGGSTLKRDNQLIYITSNMNLEQHICSRFSNPDARALARANLGARITQVIVPEGLDLFILLKLIVPAESSACA